MARATLPRIPGEQVLMMKKIDALFFLAFSLIALLWVKAVRAFKREHRDDRSFLAQYAPDGLKVISPAQRHAQFALANCIQCGLCEATLAEIRATQPDALSPEAPTTRELSPSTVLLGLIRNLPDTDLTASAIAAYRPHLHDLTKRCPARIDFTQVLVFEEHTHPF